MRILPIIVLIPALLIIGGCGHKAPGGPVAVSVIGGEARFDNPARAEPQAAGAALLGAVAQGLVRFDAQAQIVPGLSIRWAISDDGLYYTFRLDSDGPNAERVTRALKLLVRKARMGMLRDRLAPIDDIVAVTPEVIEFRLSAPCPGLITLLAEPEFAILIDGKGSGPLSIVGKVDKLTTLKLHHRADMAGANGKPATDRPILLRGEPAAHAVVRFAQGDAALVTGGGFGDMLLPKLAGIGPTSISLDPVTGLFGLRVARPTPLLMSIEVRQALSMSLDREAIGEALGVAGWRSSQSILPPGLTDLPQPTRPLWAQALANVRRGSDPTLPGRLAIARRIVEQWARQHRMADMPNLRIAIGHDPGSRILLHQLAAQWSRIGIVVERAGDGEPADLRLIDEVAPLDQADWFLTHFSCGFGPPCSEQADAALAAAMKAINPDERLRLLIEAEARLASITPFIPLAQPVRWSLAAPTLPGFKPNARAIHPLVDLIAD